MFLVLMVTRNYLESKWCFKELDYFLARFGHKPGKAFERTFIMVLEQEAEPDAQPWPEEHFSTDMPKFSHFYDDSTSGSVPRPRSSKGDANSDYNDELIRMVKRMEELYRPTANKTAAPPRKVKPPLVETPAGHSSVLLGVVSDDLIAAREKLQSSLEEQGVSVTLLSDQDIMSRSRFKALESRIDPSMVFIQLASYAAPMLDYSNKCGHLVIQTDFLNELGDRAPQEMIWCHPTDEHGIITKDDANDTSPVVVDYINAMRNKEPSFSTLDQVVARITGGGELSELRTVYIESTEVDKKAGRELREKLAQVWKKTYGSEHIPEFYAMRWDQRCNATQPECRAVILLYGNKDERSLKAQVDTISHAIIALEKPPRKWVAVAPPHEGQEGDLYWNTFSLEDEQGIKEVVEDIHQAIVTH
jgi:hypothetical protein